jgi:hypothetical protein
MGRGRATRSPCEETRNGTRASPGLDPVEEERGGDSDGIGCDEGSTQRVSEKETTPDLKEGRKKGDVQKKEGNPLERVEKCGERRPMDRAERSSPGDDGKVEKNEVEVEKGEMGSGKTGKPGHENRGSLDAFGEAKGEMGALV